MVSNQQRSELRRKRKRKEKLKSQAIIGVVVIAAITVIALIVKQETRAPVGESVEIMADSGHLLDGAVAEYNTNPPTSGLHYTSNIPAGFYDEDSLEATDPFPEGYLIHDLEHGYVIIWYNCSVLDNAGCEELKNEIKAVLKKESLKVVAFPWPNMTEPVVLTSWGQIMRMETFDAGAARDFIKTNRSHPRAPEPNAP